MLPRIYLTLQGARRDLLRYKAMGMLARYPQSRTRLPSGHLAQMVDCDPLITSAKPCLPYMRGILTSAKQCLSNAAGNMSNAEQHLAGNVVRPCTVHHFLKIQGSRNQTDHQHQRRLPGNSLFERTNVSSAGRI